ncbi:MAG: response regulator transcription factor [Nitrospiraceae bacterium]|nr:response regulator transcription factor [Nitrospiraceae bacterium]
MLVASQAGGLKRQEIFALLIDNHDLVTSSLASLLHAQSVEVGVAVQRPLSAAGVLAEAGAFVANRPALSHFALLDLNLSADLDGADLVSPLMQVGYQVVVLTGVSDRIRLARCLADGAAAIFNKTRPFHELMEMIDSIAAGECAVSAAERDLMLRELQAHLAQVTKLRQSLSHLTAAEGAVLAKLRIGLDAEQIARETYLSIHTVRSHIHWILVKLGVHSQREAIRLAEAAERGVWHGGTQPPRPLRP